jgi:hypothetical protein
LGFVSHSKEVPPVRAVDDNTPAKIAVLEKLLTWGSLPESDLCRMLRQHFLVTDSLRAMEEEGLIEMTFRGDEYLLRPTLYGRLFLEQQRKG